MSPSTIPEFTSILTNNASSARYYRSSDTSIPCPCRTPEGYRDAELHLAFGKFGPISQVTAPGGTIPANAAVAYAFLAVSADGVAISPAIQKPPLTNAVNFSVNFVLNPVTDVLGLYGGHWAIYRQEGSGPFRLLDTLPLSTTSYQDSDPLGNLGTVYVAPVLCNEAGMIPQAPVDVIVKAFVQPIQSTRATRLSTEYLQEVFGNIEADDHLGIFPVSWQGVRLKFDDWSQSGDDFVEYDGKRYFVINSNMIPDPGDGNPEHHYEVGLRLIRSDGME